MDIVNCRDCDVIIIGSLSDLCFSCRTTELVEPEIEVEDGPADVPGLSAMLRIGVQ